MQTFYLAAEAICFHSMTPIIVLYTGCLFTKSVFFTIKRKVIPFGTKLLKFPVVTADLVPDQNPGLSQANSYGTHLLFDPAGPGT